MQEKDQFEDQELIVGAKNSNQAEDFYADIEEQFSFSAFEKYILHANKNLKEVMQLIKKGDMNDLCIRFGIWRYLLDVIPVTEDLSQIRNILDSQRKQYQDYFASFKNVQQPQQAKEVKTKVKKPLNPLAPVEKKPSQQSQQQSPWQGFFEDNFLKNEIKKDVERTYQDREFFLNLKIKEILSNVLFVWSKLNPEISYRQGMNELAASLVLIYFSEALEIKKDRPENVSQDTYEIASYMINIKHAEADIYNVFNKMMEKGQADMFVHKEDGKKKLNTPILSRLAKIHDYFLKIVDIDFFRHMKLLEVQFTTFLVKWIRCIYTREFPMHETFTLWDSIFMDAYLFPNQKFENLTNLSRENYEINNFFMIDCIALAMLVRLRNEVLEIEDGADCMKAYLSYPPVESIKEIIDLSFEIKHRLQEYSPEEDRYNESKKQFQVFNPKNPRRKDSDKLEAASNHIINKKNPLENILAQKPKPKLFVDSNPQVNKSYDSDSPTKTTAPAQKLTDLHSNSSLNEQVSKSANNIIKETTNSSVSNNNNSSLENQLSQPRTISFQTTKTNKNNTPVQQAKQISATSVQQNTANVKKTTAKPIFTTIEISEGQGESLQQSLINTIMLLNSLNIDQQATEAEGIKTELIKQVEILSEKLKNDKYDQLQKSLKQTEEQMEQDQIQ